MSTGHTKNHERLVKELTEKVRDLIAKDLDKAVQTIESWVDYEEKKASTSNAKKPNYPVRKKAA